MYFRQNGVWIYGATQETDRINVQWVYNCIQKTALRSNEEHYM